MQLAEFGGFDGFPDPVVLHPGYGLVGRTLIDEMLLRAAASFD